MERTLDEYKAIIAERLTKGRYEHSCMVCEEAKKLAEKYGADIKKAETAGILHDIMKDTDKAVQLQIIGKYSIILDNVESGANKLLHAISGAAVIEHELDVNDPEILNAVRYHTTARAGMSLLEKIIYLADYISADRKYEGVEPLRAAVYQSIETGMRAALDFSISELLTKGAPVHLDTVRARNELLLA